MKKRVTIKEIADACHVSKNTVSHAIRDLPDISNATKEQVREMADRLGYVPNSAAVMLRTGGKKRIGVLYSLHRNAYYWNMMYHVNRALVGSGYEIMLLHTSRYTATAEDITDACSRGVSGLILFGKISSEGAEIIRKAKIAAVLIGNDSEYSHIDSVVDDNFGGSYEQTKYFIEKGFTKITGIYQRGNTYDRSEGYTQAMADHGMENRLVILKNHDYYHATDDVLAMYPDTEAIVCYNDSIAFDVIKRLGENGKTDIAVIGYDAIQHIMGYPRKMASVMRDDGDCAKIAVDMMMTRMESPNIDTQKVTLKMTVVDGYYLVKDLY